MASIELLLSGTKAQALQVAVDGIIKVERTIIKLHVPMESGRFKLFELFEFEICSKLFPLLSQVLSLAIQRRLK